MPVYEYECRNCGKRFDKMQPITAEPLTECIYCGEGPVRRIFHPVGVIFKGSGWYITDSRNSRQSSGATSAASATSGAGSDSSGEAATAKAGEATAKSDGTPAKKDPLPGDAASAD